MKKVILHVITELNTGGAENILANLVKFSKDSKYSNVVVSLSDEGPIGKRLSSFGFKVHSVGLNKKILSIKNIKIFKLFFIVIKERPSIIQTWLYHADFVGLFLHFFFRKPLMWTILCSQVP
ncbi:MAG: hypothetical protein HQK51_21270, partial [Oligoflexia bacterium]|nr:hypothetical protein [Oligoflexia bacterium]